MQYQCLSWCKLNLTYDNQHSQDPEDEPKIAKNSETKWKLLSNIKTDNSSFKRGRNQVDW